MTNTDALSRHDVHVARLRAAWEVLTPRQRRKLHRKHLVLFLAVDNLLLDLAVNGTVDRDNLYVILLKLDWAAWTPRERRKLSRKHPSIYSALTDMTKAGLL